MDKHGGMHNRQFGGGQGGFGGKPGMFGKQQDKFYTVNQGGNKRMRMDNNMGGGNMRGGRGGSSFGGHGGHREPFTPKELCKFFLTGSCHKGS
jgi:hypothetical protein